jgi:hypothetical protein
MDMDRELLRSVLRTAAELRPGEARRASSMQAYDTGLLTQLLTQMWEARLVLGAAVAGASGPEFILVGLTRTGGQLLADLGDDESWAAVQTLADDEWLELTVENLAAFASRQATANARRINMDNDRELRYWLARLSCTKEELSAAIAAVGGSADEVHRYIAATKLR